MIDDDRFLHDWLDRSLDYARSLSPKAPKKSKSAKRAG